MVADIIKIKKRPVPSFTAEEEARMNAAHSAGKFVPAKNLSNVVKAIRNTIKNEEDRLHAKYPILAYQNTLGMAFFLSSLAVMGSASYLYCTGKLGWFLTIVIIALATSIIHELEHDLIHNLYFKTVPAIQHSMFFIIWLTKMNIPPWYRKILHLRHHIVSGQREDIEERLIGLGQPMGIWRWLRSANHPLSALQTGKHSLSDIAKDAEKDYDQHYFSYFSIVGMSLPTVVLGGAIFQVFVEYLRATFGITFGAYDPAIYLPMQYFSYVRNFAVCVLIPNYFRSWCLSLVATYVHYFGDLPVNSVFYQNQILDHWALIPLQMFCFNFGETHIIHHYCPNTPFYLRQMTAKKVCKVMKARGTRHNDFDILRRNNFYFEECAWNKGIKEE